MTSYHVSAAEAAYLMAALSGKSPPFELPADVANRLLIEGLKLAKSLADNSRDWLETTAVINKLIHPSQVENLNVPTLEGALCHLVLVPRVNNRNRCTSCAFRPGTPASQAAGTTEYILECLESGEDFMCHWDAEDYPKRICAGFAAVRKVARNHA